MTWSSHAAFPRRFVSAFVPLLLLAAIPGTASGQG